MFKEGPSSSQSGFKSARDGSCICSCFPVVLSNYLTTNCSVFGVFFINYFWVHMLVSLRHFCILAHAEWCKKRWGRERGNDKVMIKRTRDEREKQKTILFRPVSLAFPPSPCFTNWQVCWQDEPCRTDVVTLPTPTSKQNPQALVQYKQSTHQRLELIKLHTFFMLLLAWDNCTQGWACVCPLCMIATDNLPFLDVLLLSKPSNTNIIEKCWPNTSARSDHWWPARKMHIQVQLSQTYSRFLPKL